MILRNSPLQTPLSPQPQPVCFVFTRGVRYLITASSDHSVKLWDISTGDCIKQYNGKLSIS
jgi:WD40 repeat protein